MDDTLSMISPRSPEPTAWWALRLVALFVAVIGIVIHGWNEGDDAFSGKPANILPADAVRQCGATQQQQPVEKQP